MSPMSAGPAPQPQPVPRLRSSAHKRGGSSSLNQSNTVDMTVEFGRLSSSSESDGESSEVEESLGGESTASGHDNQVSD